MVGTSPTREPGLGYARMGRGMLGEACVLCLVPVIHRGADATDDDASCDRRPSCRCQSYEAVGGVCKEDKQVAAPCAL